MAARPAVLVIAGADPSGGAGLVRDLATLAAFDVPALCVVTAVTVQTNTRFRRCHGLPPEWVREQLQAALESAPLGAVKLGMLATREIIEVVADCLPPRARVPSVLDPVLRSSSGGVLLDEAGRKALAERLIPAVTLLTPNLPEAAALLGIERAAPPDPVEQARRLLEWGPTAVLLKGGHADGAEAVDWLVTRDVAARPLMAPRIPAQLRGTGCALATAIAAGLSLGRSLESACAGAKAHVHRLLAQAAATRHPPAG